MRLLIILIIFPFYTLLGQKYKTVTASSDFVFVNTKPKVKAQISFFRADRDSVISGGKINLLWNVQNAQKTQMEVYNKDNKLVDSYPFLNTEGEIKRTITENTTFKLIADGITSSKEIFIKTPPAPIQKIADASPVQKAATPRAELTASEQPIIVFFKADKTEITKGESITLSWSVRNKENVTIFVGDNVEEIIPITKDNKVELFPNNHEIKFTPKRTQYYVLRIDKISQYIKIEVDDE